MTDKLLEKINAALIKEDDEELLLNMQQVIKDNIEDFRNTIGKHDVDIKDFNIAVNELEDSMDNLLISAGYGI